MAPCWPVAVFFFFFLTRPEEKQQSTKMLVDPAELTSYILNMRLLTLGAVEMVSDEKDWMGD